MHPRRTIFSGADCIQSFEGFIHEAANIYSGIFFLTDTNTRNECLPVVLSRFKVPENAVVLEVEPGEKSKTPETCIKLWKELAMLGADRHSLLICLGGGMICDLGGFVASAYQRGIDFIYLPTSLLAQVDAAIGGKTGVNLSNLKNYVGLFSLPKAVFVFSEFLRTLPFPELLAGYAEVIKHALLSSEKTYRKLVNQFPDLQSISASGNWVPVVSHSAKIKENVVNVDFFEKGLRKILNFGHTAGHAFESHSLIKGRQPLPHGFAVAMGLIVELQLSVALCELNQEFCDDVSSYLLSLFPFYSFEPDDIPEIVDLMGFDKKNKAGNLQMILMKRPGDLVTDVICKRQEIESCLNQYLELGKLQAKKIGRYE